MIEWLKESNRWKHLLGGVAIGVFADSMYCAGYASLIAGASMEFKDEAHGGEWDWIDLALTFVGGILGGLTKLL